MSPFAAVSEIYFHLPVLVVAEPATMVAAADVATPIR